MSNTFNSDVEGIDALKKKLETQIVKNCERKENKQDHVRTAEFTYLQWMNHESVKVLYINEEIVKNNPDIFVGKFRDFLLSHRGLFYDSDS